MQPDVEIDVEALRRTGTQVQESSRSVLDVVTKEDTQLTVAGVAAQWAAGPAITDRSAGWVKYLRDLTERVRLCGAGMVGAAIDYQLTDQESADSITATFPALQPYHGPHMGAAG
jgi:hypothetical protein